MNKRINLIIRKLIITLNLFLNYITYFNTLILDLFDIIINFKMKFVSLENKLNFLMLRRKTDCRHKFIPIQ